MWQLNVDTSGSGMFYVSRGKGSDRADLNYHLLQDFLLPVIKSLRSVLLYPRDFLANFIV